MCENAVMQPRFVQWMGKSKPAAGFSALQCSYKHKFRQCLVCQIYTRSRDHGMQFTMFDRQLVKILTHLAQSFFMGPVFVLLFMLILECICCNFLLVGKNVKVNFYLHFFTLGKNP
uniref:Uncharacterized protein n=1 Tax=Rhipicephalus microplus TaxID=6941 RepID=A0A6G5AGQ9_RHIMP